MVYHVHWAQTLQRVVQGMGRITLHKHLTLMPLPVLEPCMQNFSFYELQAHTPSL